MSDAAGREPVWRRLAWALLAAVFVLRAFTFPDYGLTWDEELERRNAELTVAWYASGATDTRLFESGDQYLYGAFFNVMVWLADAVSPLGYYETGHLLIAFMGWLATLATYRIAASLAGARAGFLAALGLTLTPVFYGHSFNNPKDVPFAALFATATWLLLRAGESLPRLPPLRALGLGACIGLAAGVRIVGLLLLGLLLAVAAARRPSGKSREARALLLGLALAALAALAVMLPWWPYLQREPLAHLRELLRNLAHFDWDRRVLFEGRQLPARELPRSYLPVWLMVSLPEFALLALPVGLWLALRGWKGRTVIASAVVPLGAAIAMRPLIYDGLRQFLFVLPAVACLAAVGLDAAWRARPLALRAAALGLAGAGMALTAVDMWTLHPYQSIYFNRGFGGGLERAAARFETDYWGSSYQEATRWLIAEYRPADGRRVKVANVSNYFLTAYYINRSPEARARFEPVVQPKRADVVLAVTRWNGHKAWPGRVLHVVTRHGVGLCYVIERDPQPISRDTLGGRNSASSPPSSAAPRSSTRAAPPFLNASAPESLDPSNRASNADRYGSCPTTPISAFCGNSRSSANSSSIEP
jgi:4-amino-4-deoxy-L-arabinose transferase-like glycosyltransferase